MKKILVATFFLAASSLALWSCNNGDYDANPKKDQSKVKNPLDPNSGVTVYIGSVEAVVNREKLLFINGEYRNVIVNLETGEIIKYITASVKDDEMFQRNFLITVPALNYEGPKFYDIGAGAFAWTFTYMVADTSVKNRLVYKKYIANTATGKGIVNFTLAGDEDQNLRGKFNGVIYRSKLNEDGVTPSGQFDMTDSVVINSAEFYIPLVN